MDLLRGFSWNSGAGVMMLPWGRVADGGKASAALFGIAFAAASTADASRMRWKRIDIAMRDDALGCICRGFCRCSRGGVC